jgi:hypothetical protein
MTFTDVNTTEAIGMKEVIFAHMEKGENNGNIHT